MRYFASLLDKSGTAFAAKHRQSNTREMNEFKPFVISLKNCVAKRLRSCLEWHLQLLRSLLNVILLILNGTSARKLLNVSSRKERENQNCMF